MEISMSTIRKGDFGATGPISTEKSSEITETASTYISGDKPENNPKRTFHTTPSQNLTFHNIFMTLGDFILKLAILHCEYCDFYTC